ncbi:ScpA family protein [Cocleimonas flava]|jgi:segregation and condensation protein A|uniref:Segregation and condensation protein A n=1 Tax=Cocleimonas flava TaxID=634765 RepID=A0A4R1F573_9GAMM|nr:ScpA family protein [Cocleimonas flava]TCJ87754.1 condensin subunit ScpA [Cocleimonas flava]
MTNETDTKHHIPIQGELPFAIVHGEAVSAPPEDLYIPPDALEVFLETFEGPLDLLLYLIRRQNLDILDIPIAEITSQYMDYVEMMRNINLDLAAEYLVMAAMLAEIKSRMLLPRHEEVEDEEDPRAELVKRLQEYERFKQAASDIDELPRTGRENFPTSVEVILDNQEKPEPEVDLREILLAFQNILKHVDMQKHHEIEREEISIRERMTHVLSRLDADNFIEFQSLFTFKEGRLGVVVTLMAVLELLKLKVIDMVQAEAFAPIYLKPVSSTEEII